MLSTLLLYLYIVVLFILPFLEATKYSVHQWCTHKALIDLLQSIVSLRIPGYVQLTHFQSLYSVEPWVPLLKLLHLSVHQFQLTDDAEDI